jgi:ABC-type glycerol-3-phosphate transport system substrate-binding protein
MTAMFRSLATCMVLFFGVACTSEPPRAPTAVPTAAPAGAATKTEGTLTWYTSTPQTQADRIAQMFEQKTGIKVQVFRSGGEAVLQRFLTE